MPEEETPDFRDLSLTLSFREIRAAEHWKGNTSVTLADVIHRVAEQGSVAGGPASSLAVIHEPRPGLVPPRRGLACRPRSPEGHGRAGRRAGGSGR